MGFGFRPAETESNSSTKSLEEHESLQGLRLT